MKIVKPYKELIVLALDQLDEYVPDTKEEYLQSRVLQDAILLQLLQVGENLARFRDISPKTFENAPESWNRVVGLRNLIAHEYRRIDPERIWRYLERDLIELRQTVEELEDS